MFNVELEIREMSLVTVMWDLDSLVCEDSKLSV